MKSAIKKNIRFSGLCTIVCNIYESTEGMSQFIKKLYGISLLIVRLYGKMILFMFLLSIFMTSLFHIPTGGWNLLDTPDKIGVTLPATVEQHLWGWNGETFGVTGNYVGVSWFDTKINVPADWRNKRIVMNVASVRFRAEIFVNKKLVGYDLVNSTPFAVDVTPFILPGQENVIAFRITDPNGNFN